MRIAVNTRLLLKDKLEGIGWFTYETLKRLTQQHPEHQFIFFFDRKYSEEFIFSDNIEAVVLPPQSRHPILWYIWFEWSITRALKKYKADVFLSPDGYLSLRTKVPSVPVIHDLNFEHYPQDMPPLYSKYYRHYFPKYAKKAARIATVSKYSKSDIVKKYDVLADKIDVVFDGCNEAFQPVPVAEQEKVRLQYTGGAPYFVYVGALHRRKNIDNLFRAFDQFRSAGNNVKLVIVGERMWRTEKIKQVYDQMKYREDVVFTGRLKAEELKNVVGSAFALTYVSYFEGFGIPILEAMNAEVPVITSNVTSMPEVAGDAALLVNPFSVQSISEAMEKITADENLRNQLIVKGKEQKEKFSWQKTSDLLMQTIEKVVKK